MQLAFDFQLQKFVTIMGDMAIFPDYITGEMSVCVGRGRIAQLVERVTPGQGVVGSFPHREPHACWLDRCQYKMIG